MYNMFREKEDASISVFLAVSITLILSFCMVLVESARENTMLLKADVVFDAGVQSVMAEFYAPLWEQYDLLYVDCSYDAVYPDYELIKSHLAEYINENLKFGNKGWLGLDYNGTGLTDVLLATDFNGKDFYLQAVHSAKASIAVSYVEQVISWFEQVEATYNMGDFLQSEAANLDLTIKNTNGMEIEVKEAVWGEDIDGNPILLEDAEYEVVDIMNPLDQILSGNVLLR